MSEPLILSVDAMGGDHGPSVVIPAIAIASSKLGPGVRFLVHGDEAKIGPQMARLPALLVKV